MNFRYRYLFLLGLVTLLFSGCETIPTYQSPPEAGGNYARLLQGKKPFTMGMRFAYIDEQYPPSALHPKRPIRISPGYHTYDLQVGNGFEVHFFFGFVAKKGETYTFNVFFPLFEQERLEVRDSSGRLVRTSAELSTEKKRKKRKAEERKKAKAEAH